MSGKSLPNSARGGSTRGEHPAPFGPTSLSSYVGIRLRRYQAAALSGSRTIRRGIEVIPLPVDLEEAAYFLLLSRYAPFTIVGYEFHNAFFIQ